MAKKKGAKKTSLQKPAAEKAAGRKTKKAPPKKKSTRSTLTKRSPKNGSPEEVRDELDSGDEMQRRLRYQHAYGVILLSGSVAGKLPYRSIWCEHHDDFLAQINGTFDSVQVKTSIPERGFWELSTEGFVGAIKKFAQQEQKFAERIDRYKFVSNARTLDSHAEAQIHKCPVRLIEAVCRARSLKELDTTFSKALENLAKKCEAEADCLYRVLRRLDIVLGPSLNDFEAALSSDHLAQLGHCSDMVPARIHAIRDELIHKIADASSKRVTDSAKHWYAVNGDPKQDPVLMAKRIDVSIVESIIQQRKPVPFRFSPTDTATDKRVARGELTKFEKKLLAAGLGPFIETMKRRTVSAEQHLLELAVRRPDEIKAIRNVIDYRLTR